MKTIKEKEALIKMSLVLGLEPDSDLVLEVARQKKLLEDIKIDGNDFVKALDLAVEQSEEKEDIVEEPQAIVEHIVIEYPKPPSLDDIAHLIIEEQVVEEVKEEPATLLETAPVPPSLEDLLEFHGIKEEEVPKNLLIDKAMNAITAQVKNEQVMNQEPKQTGDQTLSELQRKVKYLEQWISRIATTGPGSGEVNLRYLDDVDTSNLQNNYFLRYNSSNSKFEFTASSGTVANADIVSALTPGQNIGIDANGRITANVSGTSVSNTTIVSALTSGQNIGIDANGRITANVSGATVSNTTIVSALTGGQNISIAANGLITSTATGGGSVDLGNVSSNIVPAADSTYNLGAPDKRFQTLYLANNTIDLGGTLISSDGTGILSISAQGAILPQGSKINLNDQEKEIALVGNTGTVVHIVPFYTQALGLNTIAKNFEFGTDPDSYTFNNFTLNNGSLISTTARAQFYF